ncbi:MAG: HEPN domain-containing protein [Steroidobacteraceae bacterium]
MASRRREGARRRFSGTFTLRDGESVSGELALRGEDTILRVHSSQFLVRVEESECIRGLAHSGEHLTLIDCLSGGVGHVNSTGQPTRYYADVFPHYVAVGRHHLDPRRKCICGIHFTTDNLPQLFYDFDAFGHVIDANAVIDAVLEERRRIRPVDAGEHPLVLYFTGKECIADVRTVAGRISVHHRPRYNLGGPAGVYIKNRIDVSIEPDQPVTLGEAVSRMYDVACFLSMAAGRAQGIHHIHVSIDAGSENSLPPLVVHPSHRWRASDEPEQHALHPADLPLDPVRRREEFDSVLANWIARHEGWRVARVLSLECLRKANRYGSERLVTAANMFDNLPAEAVPTATALPPDLSATRDACREMFHQLPQSVDRDRALSDLSRLGAPSLRKKVAHRAALVESRLGTRFPELQRVVSVAVRCRNFFVHASSDGLDYPKVAPLLSFLTDALEFVFAASDLIEAGWDPEPWTSEAHGWGHRFARFRHRYPIALAELRRAMNWSRSNASSG